jgi:hypothetical protein
MSGRRLVGLVNELADRPAHKTAAMFHMTNRELSRLVTNELAMRALFTPTTGPWGAPQDNCDPQVAYAATAA